MTAGAGNDETASVWAAHTPRSWPHEPHVARAGTLEDGVVETHAGAAAGRASERRESYRLPVGGRNVRAVVASCPGHLVTVADLSASGGSLVVPEGLAARLHDAWVELRLGERDPVLAQLTPVRWTGDQGVAHVGVRLGKIDAAGLRSLSWFLIDCFAARSRLLAPSGTSLTVRSYEVRSLLTVHAISRAGQLRVFDGGEPLPVALCVRELTTGTPPKIVAEASPGKACPLVAGREYTFAYPGANAVNAFRAAVVRAGRGVVELTMPPWIDQWGFRRSVRTRLPPAERGEVTLRHARFPGQDLRRPIIDVGGTGLSFPFDPGRDVLFPGETLDDVQLAAGDVIVQARAIVRRTSSIEGSGPAVCGLEVLEFGDAVQERRWKHFVFQASHPQLRVGASRRLARAAWRVLEASGYLEETTADRRPHLRPRYLAAWPREPDELASGRCVVSFRGDRPVGTLAAHLIYPDTWLVHHLGIDAQERIGDPARFMGIAREMYSGMIFLLDHLVSARHFVLYVDASKSWNEVMYGRFLRTYPGADEFVYDRASVFKGSPSVVCAHPRVGNEGIEVASDDPALARQLSSLLLEHVPPLEFEAYRYAPGAIGLEAFSEQCASMGYERRRRVFYAVRRGEIGAALVAETGHEGTNVFGLLNRCWLAWPHGYGLAVESDLLAALLAAARRYYAAARKNEFIFLAPEDGSLDATLCAMGFARVAPGLRWLARRSILPAYLNYMEELFEIKRAGTADRMGHHRMAGAARGASDG